MKFYWKMIKPEKSVEKDNNNEDIEADSQEGVEKIEDDTISEMKDKIDPKDEFAEESDDEDSQKYKIDANINKSNRMGSILKFSMQK